MAEKPCDPNNGIPVVTVFQLGYINKKGIAVPSPYPLNNLNLLQIYQYIKGNGAKQATEDLRAIDYHAEAQKFKALSFYPITPAGTFTYRKADKLIQHSELMVIDIDDITSKKRLKEIRKLLLEDPVIETELLFVSPSGNGLKWIICVGKQTAESHSDLFAHIKQYLEEKYGIIADKSGRDVSRICYLPHDPECYINPEFLEK